MHTTAAASQLSMVAGLREHLMAPRKIFGERKGHTCPVTFICDHVPAHTNRSLEATAGGYPHCLPAIHPGHSTLLGQDQAWGEVGRASGMNSHLDKTTEPMDRKAKRCLLFTRLTLNHSTTPPTITERSPAQVTGALGWQSGALFTTETYFWRRQYIHVM